MKRLTLNQTVALSCLLTFIAFGGTLGYLLTSFLEHSTVLRASHDTAEILREEVLHVMPGEDLGVPKTGPAYAAFTEKIRLMSLGPDVVRIKVWNADRSVVWSDQQDLVGQSFPDNEELNEAIEDRQVKSELSLLEKSEQRFERRFTRLLELYVPITGADGATVSSVFEIYLNLDPLYEDIAASRRLLWSALIAGFSALYIILFLIIRQASRLIESQTAEIIRSSQRFGALLTSAKDGIVSVDQAGRVVLFNEAAQQITGYAAAEVLTRPSCEFVPERYRARCLAGLQHFAGTGEILVSGSSFEVEAVRRDGAPFPLELSLSVSGPPGERMITAVFRDISERKTLQRKLIDSELRASVAVLASSIGHEIKNLISPILGYGELLKESPGNEALVREGADVLISQSRFLTEHATNLLALGKPHAPDMKPLPLAELLDRTTNLLVVSGLLKYCTIVRDYASAPVVRGDARLLEQVVRNLETNAAHAMARHGTLTLAIRPAARPSMVEFSITDTGPGIPPDKLADIFVPFYTTKAEGQGTGLGMSIVKECIEEHQGYINVASNPGQGTTVTVGLPLADGSAPAAGEPRG